MVLWGGTFYHGAMCHVGYNIVYHGTLLQAFRDIISDVFVRWCVMIMLYLTDNNQYYDNSY